MGIRRRALPPVASASPAAKPPALRMLSFQAHHSQPQSGSGRSAKARIELRRRGRRPSHRFLFTRKAGSARRRPARTGRAFHLQVLGMEDCLWRVLLRAQVIVDEAMGWHITNQAMLQELNVLRDAIHRGCYVSDNF
ncbi:hypothetical protein SEVIR_1G307450v4 [Setaria viridis]|nr:uncharacterized protein LOC101770336 [Setaria italica]XP_034579736.1 uncharacterized protein LOC117843275 [Setaria viridis]TKW41336.1 hypothetical protein SEVIR_1G307450v2 [Setaria viridis]TKW41337.1 hypothetical protein SEVIR_1G307450v2 [Setaria viridis]